MGQPERPRGDTMKAMTKRRATAEFRVGDRVRFSFGGRPTVGTIIEDRGPLGVGGRRIIRVRVDIADTEETLEFEIPASDVKSAA
jgi:hypothetical protein